MLARKEGGGNQTPHQEDGLPGNSTGGGSPRTGLETGSEGAGPLESEERLGGVHHEESFSCHFGFISTHPGKQ